MLYNIAVDSSSVLYRMRLVLGNPSEIPGHEELCSNQPMSPPKRFDTISLDNVDAQTEGLDACLLFP